MNHLANETSPYLLQHAFNPVQWYPWSEQAWEKARKEQKLVIVSVGYSACHWCHVMEHESFEDELVAELMNRHFISIKVDREERPDVDQIYMDACQLITGHGGWPLNAITLPDGRPIFAGTYFPREHWKQLLGYFEKYWREQAEEAMERATNITRGISVMDQVVPPQDQNELRPEHRTAMAERIVSGWDMQYGGRAGAPKFMMPSVIRYLLRTWHYTKSKDVFHAAKLALDGMMNGGVYDHAGGGFARYSVDERWEIPHFEKMLYDNAQLISLYSEAFKITADPRYRLLVSETVAFLHRDLSAPEGGFYSALDADSDGEEGKFYVYTIEELRDIIGPAFQQFTSVFEISAHGNFEGRIHLNRRPGDQGVSEDQITEWKTALRRYRSRRVRPGLDDKILTSWNALTVSGLVEAFHAFGAQAYLTRAESAADYLFRTVVAPDGLVYRNSKNGKPAISGFLDDYAFLAQACLDLYQATFKEKWLIRSREIADYVVQHFYNAASGLFFYTSVKDDALIARKTELSDNVIVSSNSAMARLMMSLGKLLATESYELIARKAASSLKENTLKHPGFYANWAALTDWVIDEPYVVVITGPAAAILREQVAALYLPHVIMAGATESSDLPHIAGRFDELRNLIFVCRGKTCHLPVGSVEEMLQITGGRHEK